MRKTVLLGALVLAGSATAAGPGIMPGLYRVVTTGDNAETKQHCVSAAEAAHLISMPEEGASCRTMRQVYGGGRIDVAFTCGPVAGTALGSYTPTSYTFDQHVTVSAGGRVMKTASHTVATRIGATCTSDD